MIIQNTNDLVLPLICMDNFIKPSDKSIAKIKNEYELLLTEKTYHYNNLLKKIEKDYPVKNKIYDKPYFKNCENIKKIIVRNDHNNILEIDNPLKKKTVNLIDFLWVDLSQYNLVFVFEYYKKKTTVPIFSFKDILDNDFGIKILSIPHYFDFNHNDKLLFSDNQIVLVNDIDLNYHKKITTEFKYNDLYNPLRCNYKLWLKNQNSFSKIFKMREYISEIESNTQDNFLICTLDTSSNNLEEKLTKSRQVLYYKKIPILLEVPKNIIQRYLITANRLSIKKYIQILHNFKITIPEEYSHEIIHSDETLYKTELIQRLNLFKELEKYYRSVFQNVKTRTITNYDLDKIEIDRIQIDFQNNQNDQYEVEIYYSNKMVKNYSMSKKEIWNKYHHLMEHSIQKYFEL